jgi:DNA-binding IclR family transcriptional regulator
MRRPAKGRAARRGEENGPYDLSTLSRAFDLLDAFRGENTELRASELAQHLALPKSTVFRYALALERRGYLERDPVSNRLRLGSAVRELAASAALQPDLRKLALPYARELLERSGETVNFGVPVNGWVEYVFVLESNHRVRMVPREGEREYMHCTALGKAILAYLPGRDVERIVQVRGLPALTAHTMRTLDALLRDLRGVRKRGFALDVEENEVGGLCVGAAILRDGVPLGALSISGPLSRFDLRRAKEAGVEARVFAKRVAEELQPSQVV